MKLDFRVRKHVIRRETCVEVYNQNNRLVAVIYPQDYGLRVISKYILGMEHHAPPDDIPEVRITLKENEFGK